jgi:hypothetical protein
MAALALSAAAGVANAELVYGVTQNGFLVNWDSASPMTINSGSAIQGLQNNETLVGIDFRPATGELFGMGSFSRLYRINTSNGVATQVGSPFSTPLSGSSFGFDFNPTVDRIRVVSDADQNLRLNPITGAVAAVDTPLSYAVSDVNFGVDPNAVHSAYTNNFAGATSTRLYNVDTGLDVLTFQDPPNGGILRTVGPIGTDVSDIGGFDISSSTGIAYMTIRDTQLNRSTFWTINLQTGQGTMVGEVGGGAIITAMSVVIPAPGTLGLAGLAGLAAMRRRRA